jgi:peptide-methionine (R)-S-oxide reductase
MFKAFTGLPRHPVSILSVDRRRWQAFSLELDPISSHRPACNFARIHDNVKMAFARRDMTEKITKSDSEWRKILTPEQYHVTRKKGTEPPGTGEYEDTDTPGTYVCVCCGQPLFDSDTKYHSGSGWPSFYAPLDESKVEIDRDTSYGMLREEVLCSRCDAHLGHVFPDGPQPTGLRY